MPENIRLRSVRPTDREAVAHIEAGAMPNHRYLEEVFDEFIADERGGFGIAEIDGRPAGCGKFTILPDGSAWLESLRVSPEYQGLGVGKEFYRWFFHLARPRGVTTMRMYTGVTNAASKGLAELFGFSVAATFRGALAAPEHLPETGPPGTLSPIDDPGEVRMTAARGRREWGDFTVMNRTFFTFSPDTLRVWAREGKFYGDSLGNIAFMGARFMPEREFHIAYLGGDAEVGLREGIARARETGVSKIACLFPPHRTDIGDLLRRWGFSFDAHEFIVMEGALD